MAELFTEEHVWHPLCCHGMAYQRSSSLSHLCHLIFIPIKPLFHNSFLSLSCLNLLLFPLFVLQSVYSVFFFLPHSWSFSLWFLFRQQSISLFNLMLFSCLSRLCVWFGFSWRLAEKEQDFIRRYNSKKETALLERNPEKKSKNSTNDSLLTN